MDQKNRPTSRNKCTKCKTCPPDHRNMIAKLLRESKAKLSRLTLFRIYGVGAEDGLYLIMFFSVKRMVSTVVHV